MKTMKSRKRVLRRIGSVEQLDTRVLLAADGFSSVMADFSPEQAAQEELASFDTNGDEHLSLDELAAEFGGSEDGNDSASQLMSQFDTDNDSQLSLDELVASWSGTGSDYQSFDSDYGFDIDILNAQIEAGGEIDWDAVYGGELPGCGEVMPEDMTAALPEELADLMTQEEFDALNENSWSYHSDIDDGFDIDVLDAQIEAGGEIDWDAVYGIETDDPGDDLWDGLGTLAQEELDLYDADGNGSVSVAEYAVGFDNADAEALVAFYDTDGDNELSLSEIETSFSGNGSTDIDDGFDIDLLNAQIEAGGEIDWDAVFGIETDDPDDDLWDGLGTLAQEELDLYDADGNGSVSVAEYAVGFDNADAEALVAFYDTDGDNELSLSEIETSFSGNGSTDGTAAAEELAAIELEEFDANDDGSISVDEYVEGLGLDTPELMEFATEIVATFDLDDDDALSLSELVASYGGHVAPQETPQPAALPSAQITTEANRPAGVEGDINGDGTVNAIDLNFLALGWNTEASDSEGDLNGDGEVNAADLNLLALNWLNG